MSRVGKKPIPIPSGVKVKIQDSNVEVSGPKGTLNVQVHDRIHVKMDSSEVVCTRPSDEKIDRALHGTTRSLLANAVKGVHEGFKKDFEIVGIGYRVALEKKKLVLTVGYSHPVEMDLPADLQVTFDEKNKNKFTLSGADKQKVGQFAAKLRSVRPPDPYKGKGIRYAGEMIRLKEGKKKA